MCPRHILSMPRLSVRTYVPPSLHIAASMTIFDAFAKTDAARTIGLKAGAFSYNTGKLRCATCDGTGSISLDVQFLPDVDIECPACHGSRYSDAIAELKLPCTDGVAYSMPQLMTMTVDDAMPVLRDVKPIQTKLATLHELGLGYLALGEPTPALSGGEAQRLKLASEMGRKQHDAVFVFDEPTIGLHPLDVRVLLHVFDELVANGATVVVIEHDLDVIANADYVVDMGPGGGEAGGRVVCEGAPSDRRMSGKRHWTIPTIVTNADIVPSSGICSQSDDGTGSSRHA